MKIPTVGQTVEFHGRQGFVTTVFKTERRACVWFLVPPYDDKTRYHYLNFKDLKEKPKIKPKRLNGKTDKTKTRGLVDATGVRHKKRKDNS